MSSACTYLYCAHYVLTPCMYIFDKKGVGVLIYVKSEILNPTDRTDFENSSFKECKWVDIHVENEKNIDRCLL